MSMVCAVNDRNQFGCSNAARERTATFRRARSRRGMIE
jgi:hypothetical protein